MKAIRVVLTQQTAHYKKEETIDNKMTYPLPPPSTVIGAIHSACGFKDYVPMKVGIVGKYNAMSKRVYTDHMYFNSMLDDRGILVKCPSSKSLSNGHIVVAKSSRQGSSFKTKQDIDIENEVLLDEYNSLKEQKQTMKDDTSSKLSTIKESLNDIKKLKKTTSKGTTDYQKALDDESKLKSEKKAIENKYNIELYTISEKLDQYNLLNKSLKSYEELHQVELVIYIHVEDENLLDLLSENLCKFKCIGRSEYLVDFQTIELVELSENTEEICLDKQYYSYVDIKLIRNDDLSLRVNDGIDGGTIYYLNRDYLIENNKRKFNKVKV